MAILSTGNTFGATDTVTSTKLNNIADAATFDDPVDNSTLELHTDGKLRIKAGGVTKAKIEDVADMKVLGNTSGAAAAPQEVSVLDEDDMSSDSATAIATQQSIKAYVDGDNSFNTTDGYQKFPGGLIVQFGHRTTDSVSGWTTTSFPTSFTNKCMFVNIIEEGGSSRNFNIRNISTTSFESEAINVPSNEARYFAIGY